MIKGMHPPRVYEPLMHAPVFSEDLNLIPFAAQKSTNDIALTIDDKLVLPRDKRQFHRRNVAPKRSNNDASSSSKKFKTSYDNNYNKSKPYAPARKTHDHSKGSFRPRKPDATSAKTAYPRDTAAKDPPSKPKNKFTKKGRPADGKKQ